MNDFPRNYGPTLAQVLDAIAGAEAYWLTPCVSPVVSIAQVLKAVAQAEAFLQAA